ncbi:glycosyltransferase family 2 protein [Flavobacterium sp. PS2]|uniref:glycosyltransferase family 2 protein n=1 Tax=Flavobacterium sp. PS2 TaxID=3384157 RepID=UPI00390C5B13
MQQDNTPILSVICTSFNHEKYIKECLDGFVMQQTNFLFEIIVHDDASTDSTAEIVKDYEIKHPNLFFNIYQSENQFTKKGVNIWYDIMLPKARGKYIAICEGDDYWTDSLKLQRQVDFLERNKNLTFCTHRYKIFYENDNSFDKNIHPLNQNLDENIEINKDVFFKDWLSQPLSAVVIKDDLLDALSKYSYFKHYRDYHIFYFLLQKGKGICLNFCAGVYRINDGGIFSGNARNDKMKTAFLINEELYLYTKDYRFLFLYWKYVFVIIRNMEGFKLFLKSFISNFNFRDKLKSVKYFLLALFDSIVRK